MEEINRTPPDASSIAQHHKAVKAMEALANRAMPHAAKPITPNPDLMPQPDMPPTPTTSPQNPKLDPHPPLSYFGIAPDLQLQFNLETLNYILQSLFPDDPFSRGVLYSQTLIRLNAHIQLREGL